MSTLTRRHHRLLQQILCTMLLLPGLSLIAIAAPASSTPESSASEPAASADSSLMQDEMVDGHVHPGMSAALGAYPMTREASGTAWQPDTSEHAGVHFDAGEWMMMSHALLNAVYDHQQRPRGDDKTFVSGMLMAAATRVLEAGDILRLRGMFSPDPLMGSSGYPLLLATGETGNGKDPLIDRQHPHNLVMELSGSFSHPLGSDSSVFLYAGLPGEPAFGPPAFMHRLSILDSPEAPISHHWLDSTHISNGVVTLGYEYDTYKLEASRFYGREPDQHRYRIEPGPLDSTAARLSWNPTKRLALQVSWARQMSPEQLAAQEDETRASASVIYTVPLGEHQYWSTTAAYGFRRSTGGPQLSAYVLESAVKPTSLWTIFARFERETNNELLDLQGQQGPVFAVAKTSIGAIRDMAIAPHLKVGFGALYAVNFLPTTLGPLYGRTDPIGMMVFGRLKIE